MEIKLESLQTILVAVMFLVPGFIMYSTFSLFTPRRTETKELLYLRFIALSVLNIGVCWPWVIKLVLNPAFVKGHPLLTRDYLLGVTFVAPLALGFLVSLADNWNLTQGIGKLFSLKAMHPSPSAWDHVFKRIGRSGARFVKVTLKDGKEVAGLYNEDAIASTDSAERDFYLVAPHAASLATDGTITWLHQPQSEGILIVGSEIRAIEFLYPTDRTAARRKLRFTRTRPWVSWDNTEPPHSNSEPTVVN